MNGNYKKSICLLAKKFSIFSFSLLITTSASFAQLSPIDTDILLKDSAINTGHIGISIYEPATNQYWYNYNETKYFVPASNTKLFTLYSGMKYLKDSLAGLKYQRINNETILISPTGDPTFLHPDFKKQRVFNFLKSYKKIIVVNTFFPENFVGKGWAWDDYKEAFMAQRSNFPIYGNLIQVKCTGTGVAVTPKVFSPTINDQMDLTNGFDAVKSWDNNQLTIIEGSNETMAIPFVPKTMEIMRLLRDTLHTTVLPDLENEKTLESVIYSQPTDNLFKSMMYNSDNFFAEQTLLMVSNEKLGYMNDESIIDTLLKNDLNDIPQKPKWVDGCGLSRYNLFTPQSFVYILNKMKTEFGFERLKNILPGGDEGTLKGHYLKACENIIAKTGTLSNNTSLSGFIITKQKKVLAFSILVNNFQGSAIPVKRAIEKFVENIYEKY